MKPSCAVMKLMLACGCRRSPWNRSGRARQPVADLGGQVLVALPVAAHGVAVLAVPLAPRRREVAHLVAAEPDVPRLGDQLHPRQHRILVDDLEDGRLRAELALPRPAQRRRQVEAEAVDVHLAAPSSAANRRSAAPPAGCDALTLLPRAGEVQVVARAPASTSSRSALSMPRRRQRRAQVVALAGVVVDDVEDHLDAGGVQRLDHRLELRDLRARRAARSCSAARARRSRACCSPSSCAARLSSRNPSSANSCTGSSSTAVTPSLVRCSIDGRVGQAGVGAAQRARARSGCSLVRPRTCAS